MFTLVTDRCEYYKVKRGQGAREIENTLFTPAGEVFAGAIIPVSRKKLEVYRVKPAETYKSIAEKFSCSESELKALNGGKPVFPACRLFVPCK